MYVHDGGGASRPQHVDPPPSPAPPDRQDDSARKSQHSSGAAAPHAASSSAGATSHSKLDGARANTQQKIHEAQAADQHYQALSRTLHVPNAAVRKEILSDERDHVTGKWDEVGAAAAYQMRLAAQQSSDPDAAASKESERITAETHDAKVTSEVSAALRDVRGETTRARDANIRKYHPAPIDPTGRYLNTLKRDFAYFDAAKQIKSRIDDGQQVSLVDLHPDDKLKRGDLKTIVEDYEKRGAASFFTREQYDTAKYFFDHQDAFAIVDVANDRDGGPDGTIKAADVASALKDGAAALAKVPAKIVRDGHTPEFIAAYMAGQNLNDRKGLKNALVAYSGLTPEDMKSFVTAPQNRAMMRELSTGVQAHQDWYENLTRDFDTVVPFHVFVNHAKVRFSKEQLVAMRDAFSRDDQMYTNGELLLAFPDRQERNEAVTQQYNRLSNGMAGILGKDNANWATFAVWASDEIGRNLERYKDAEATPLLNNPAFWLSKGNTKLASDIAPAFNHFVETFGGGKNRDMKFGEFWSSFETKYAGRGISYLKGGNPDPAQVDKTGAYGDDMKNAFKAYYEVMHLQDRAARSGGTTTAADVSRSQQLMLYANTLVGLQEQKLVQKDISEAAKFIGVTNPFGLGASSIDLHLPGDNGKGERTINTDQDIPQTPYRVEQFDATFVTSDGRKIVLGDAIRDRLNGLDGNPNNENEFDRAQSGTDHWEQYSQRMGSIYHLFASYQRAPELFADPRSVFSSRAEQLDNEPDPFVNVVSIG